MAGEIKVRKSLLEKILVVLSVIGGVAAFAFFPTPYTSFLVFTVMLLVWGAYYAYLSKEKMSEMCCMMSGMAFGMIAGFFIGVIAGLATGDFLVGMVAGTVAGVVFGIPIGKFGGPLGRMEGVMAGPMGGIMGGMTGVMVRFYNVSLFMPFFALVILFTIWEMTRVIHNQSSNISRSFVYIGIILSILIFSSTLMNSYSVESTGLAFAKEQPSDVKAPSGNIQEVTVKMEAVNYNPNYITVKKGIPVRINLEAAPNAGCTRSIVFPDFNIRKVVARGGKDTIEFTPKKSGTFRFSCSMAMAGGTLIVQ